MFEPYAGYFTQTLPLKQDHKSRAEEVFLRFEPGMMLYHDNLWAVLHSAEPFLPDRRVSFLEAPGLEKCSEDQHVDIIVSFRKVLGRKVCKVAWDKSQRDKVLWPYNYGLHWVLLVFDLQQQVVTHYCSLGAYCCSLIR